MLKMRFCPYCRVQHPESDMVFVKVRPGVSMWRCKKVEAARKKPVIERDAFGRETSKKNKQTASAHAKEMNVRKSMSI